MFMPWNYFHLATIEWNRMISDNYVHFRDHSLNQMNIQFEFCHWSMDKYVSLTLYLAWEFYWSNYVSVSDLCTDSYVDIFSQRLHAEYVYVHVVLLYVVYSLHLPYISHTRNIFN